VLKNASMSLSNICVETADGVHNGLEEKITSNTALLVPPTFSKPIISKLYRVEHSQTGSRQYENIQGRGLMQHIKIPIHSMAGNTTTQR